MQNSDLIMDLFTSSKYLEIPIYQRSYDWKKNNCKKLFDDLENLARSSNKDRMHFFGSIIIMIDQDTGHYVIIDGQQRITTTALLMAAIRDVLKEGLKTSSDADLADKLNDSLIYRYGGKIFLIPVAKDREAYRAIVERDVENYDVLSNMTTNYQLFRERILKSNLTLDELMAAVQKLYVMIIRLNSLQDDAQMVFESINSTGLNLSEGDKIRNYLLMNHSVKDQNAYYEKYWCKIDDDSVDLSSFFRDYITALTGNIPKWSDVYESFKQLSEDYLDDDHSFVELFENVLYYKKIYADLVSSNLDHISKKSSNMMYYLNNQGANVSYPFLMRVMDRFNKGLISSKDVDSVMEIIENYSIRRMVCGLLSNGLNKMYMSLYQVVSRVDSSSFPEVLKYVLMKKEGAAQYPRDDAVREALHRTDIYHQSSTCQQVLAILEHANSDSANILKRIEDHELTIEHIMPQKPSESWQQELGEGWEEFHKDWVHKIGNLTLTAYNSEYSNRPYAEKRELPDYGFLYSPLRLNIRMKDSESWGKDEIMSRNEELIEDFIRFVPELTTEYKPSDSNDDTPQEYTMDEDDDYFQDMRIRGYIYNGEVHKTRTGAEAYTSLVSEICSENPKIIRLICQDNSSGKLGKWFTDNPETAAADKDYVEVCPGVWAFKSISHSKKASLLRKLADAYGIDHSDVALIGIK